MAEYICVRHANKKNDSLTNLGAGKAFFFGKTLREHYGEFLSVVYGRSHKINVKRVTETAELIAFGGKFHHGVSKRESLAIEFPELFLYDFRKLKTGTFLQKALIVDPYLLLIWVKKFAQFFEDHKDEVSTYIPVSNEPILSAIPYLVSMSEAKLECGKVSNKLFNFKGYDPLDGFHLSYKDDMFTFRTLSLEKPKGSHKRPEGKLIFTVPVHEYSLVKRCEDGLKNHLRIHGEK